jgi:Diguanylate cyclase, GGDEF domain
MRSRGPPPAPCAHLGYRGAPVRDEFIVGLVEIGSAAALATLQRIRQHLSDAMHQQHWPVTFSIDVATFTSPPVSVDVLIQRADQLMYAAKQSGKNAVRHAVIGAPRCAQTQRQLIRIMTRSVNRCCVALSPLVDCTSYTRTYQRYAASATDTATTYGCLCLRSSPAARSDHLRPPDIPGSAPAPNLGCRIVERPSYYLHVLRVVGQTPSSQPAGPTASSVTVAWTRVGVRDFTTELLVAAVFGFSGTVAS